MGTLPVKWSFAVLVCLLSANVFGQHHRHHPHRHHDEQEIELSPEGELTEKDLIKIINLATAGEQFENKPEIYYAADGPGSKTEVVQEARHHHRDHHPKFLQFSSPSSSGYSSDNLAQLSQQQQKYVVPQVPVEHQQHHQHQGQHQELAPGFEIVSSFELPSQHAEYAEDPGSGLYKLVKATSQPPLPRRYPVRKPIGNGDNLIDSPPTLPLRVINQASKFGPPAYKNSLLVPPFGGLLRLVNSGRLSQYHHHGAFAAAGPSEPILLRNQPTVVNSQGYVPNGQIQFTQVAPQQLPVAPHQPPVVAPVTSAQSHGQDGESHQSAHQLAVQHVLNAKKAEALASGAVYKGPDGVFGGPQQGPQVHFHHHRVHQQVVPNFRAVPQHQHHQLVHHQHQPFQQQIQFARIQQASAPVARPLVQSFAFQAPGQQLKIFHPFFGAQQQPQPHSQQQEQRPQAQVLTNPEVPPRIEMSNEVPFEMTRMAAPPASDDQEPQQPEQTQNQGPIMMMIEQITSTTTTEPTTSTTTESTTTTTESTTSTTTEAPSTTSEDATPQSTEAPEEKEEAAAATEVPAEVVMEHPVVVMTKQEEIQDTDTNTLSESEEALLDEAQFHQPEIEIRQINGEPVVIVKTRRVLPPTSSRPGHKSIVTTKVTARFRQPLDAGSDPIPITMEVVDMGEATQPSEPQITAEIVDPATGQQEVIPITTTSNSDEA